MNKSFSYLNSADNFTSPYIRIPKSLFYSEDYMHLSPHAKTLFIYMFDRFGISLKNNWHDQNGNTYIYLTCKEAAFHLNCSEGKAIKVFNELDIKNGTGLIKRVRQGLGKPDIIYLNKSILDYDNTSAETENLEQTQNFHNQNIKYQNTDNKNLRISKTQIQNLSDLKTNNINYNNNYKNNNNSINLSSSDRWIEKRNNYFNTIKQNVDYEVLIGQYHKDIIDEILASMVNAISSPQKECLISGHMIPTEEIKRRFLSMKQYHIEYVYNSFMKNKSSIKNISAYILTSIYRAYDTVSLHYQNMANHDLLNFT